MERDSVVVLERPYDHERRTRDDTETWAAEVLDGPMRTGFEFIFDGRELYGEDGSPLRPIFSKAIKDAERKAAFDPRLKFEVRRNYLELDELEDMYAMAQGELGNTMVVVSDSPEELENFSDDIGGYNVTRKQTMLRIITRTEDGTIFMRSQSLDRSDRQGLEAIYAALGFTPLPGELLGQRMHLDLAAEDQEFLPDLLTGVYDRSLSQKYGGEWYAGRTPAEMINTYDFVRNQRDLIGMFVEAKLQDPVRAESLRYGLAATLEKRFTKRKTNGIADQNAQTTHPQFRNQLLDEVQLACSEAQVMGKVFSGCGLTIEQTDSLTQTQLEEAGYGKKTCVEVKNGQIVKCPDCKKQVKAIVPDKETIYCSNPACKLAHPKLANDYKRSKAANN